MKLIKMGDLEKQTNYEELIIFNNKALIPLQYKLPEIHTEYDFQRNKEEILELEGDIIALESNRFKLLK